MVAQGKVTVKSPVVAAFLDGVRTSRWDGMLRHYAPDVRSDITVPEWRFSFRGVDKAIQYLESQEGFNGPRELKDVRVFEAGEFVALTFEEHGRCPGDHHHQAHGEGARESWIFVLRDGKVVEQILHCAGEWDEETFTRIEAEAPTAE